MSTDPVPLDGLPVSGGRLRWGILGCARVVQWAIRPGFRSSKLGIPRAIASRDPEKARRWARELRIPVAHESYRALLDDPEIDAVYLPLPNDLHHRWTIEAARAGKHVLCEKPLAMDAGQAREMAACCRERGVLLREGFMWRHQPRTLGLLRMVREGAVGDLRMIRASFSYAMQADPWRLDPAHGGGALGDAGSYALNAARLFAGAEPVEARSLAEHGPSGVDLSVTAELRFPGGVLAAIDASYRVPLRNSYELAGSLGSIEVPDAFVTRGRPVAILLVGKRRRTLRFRRTDPYAAMLDDFAREVIGGSPSPAEDGVAQMEAIDAIRRDGRRA